MERRRRESCDLQRSCRTQRPRRRDNRSFSSTTPQDQPTRSRRVRVHGRLPPTRLQSALWKAAPWRQSKRPVPYTPPRGNRRHGRGRQEVFENEMRSAAADIAREEYVEGQREGQRLREETVDAARARLANQDATGTPPLRKPGGAGGAGGAEAAARPLPRPSPQAAARPPTRPSPQSRTPTL